MKTGEDNSTEDRVIIVCMYNLDIEHEKERCIYVCMSQARGKTQYSNFAALTIK